ncbi:GNAT family N-acetyltransferase [Parachlamydia sp.]|uniref:GNAT family N-acetyltransferase n=1 Tax=Parachlamydia sp. TaxID=2052048 RepID=UPI003D14990E
MKKFYLWFLILLSMSVVISAQDVKTCTYQIVKEEHDNPYVSQKILQGLQNHMLPFFKEKKSQFFMVYARDANAEVIGGLSGDILGSSACIDYMWVDEKYRCQGIGTRLLKELEAYAKAKNCTHVQLFTYDFQAKKFYQKLGFQCVSSISNWVENYELNFFKKEI